MNRALRILVVSQYYSPDVTAAAFRIQETVELLRRRGHHVTVVTARPHKGLAGGASAPLPAEPDVIRTPIFAYSGGGKWNYIAHYLSFLLAAVGFGVLRTRGRYDIVWASSPPLFVGIAGWLLAGLKRARFVLDIRDIWPDSAVAVGQIRRESRLYRLGKVLEHFLYRRAAAISCVAAPMAEYIADEGATGAVTVVYNGIPQQMIDVAGAMDATIDNAPGTPLKICYVGNFGYCQALGLILDVAAQLDVQGEGGLCFELIGAGVEKPELIARKDAQQLRTVEIGGPVSKDEALAATCRAAALFLQLKDDGTLEKTIPSKVFDYLAAGRPILFGIEGEGRALLERHAGNLYFQANDAASLRAALERLRTEYPALARLAQQNRAIAAEFTREAMCGRLEALFYRVAS